MTHYVHPDRSQWWSVDTIELFLRQFAMIYGKHIAMTGYAFWCDGQFIDSGGE